MCLEVLTSQAEPFRAETDGKAKQKHNGPDAKILLACASCSTQLAKIFPSIDSPLQSICNGALFLEQIAEVPFDLR